MLMADRRSAAGGHTTRNVRPEPSLRAGKRVTAGLVRFRKHCWPCGQPAVEGGSGRFRPVPPQAGHFKRMNAMPSDFPFKSTGFATYPVPPQLGQSFGLTPLPPSLVAEILPEECADCAVNVSVLRITNKSPGVDRREPQFNGSFQWLVGPGTIIQTLNV